MLLFQTIYVVLRDNKTITSLATIILEMTVHKFAFFTFYGYNCNIDFYDIFQQKMTDQNQFKDPQAQGAQDDSQNDDIFGGSDDIFANSDILKPIDDE